MRISKDQYYLDIAMAVAERSTCLRKHYGAVLVKDDRIVSTGYNGAPRGEANCCDTFRCCRDDPQPRGDLAKRHGAQYGTCVAVHAEMNAMLNASAADMRGATLYLMCLNSDGEVVEALPCNTCERMLKNAGITRFVGGVGSGDL